MLKLCLLVLVVSAVYVELSEANAQHGKRRPAQNHAAHRPSAQTRSAQRPAAHGTHKSSQRKPSHVSQQKSGHSQQKRATHKAAIRKRATHKPAPQKRATHKPAPQKRATRKPRPNKVTTPKPVVNNPSPQKAENPQPAPQQNGSSGKPKIHGDIKTKPWKNTSGKRAPVGKGGASRLRNRPKRAGKGCDDTASNCEDFLNFCTNPSYKALLKEHCSMTCGYCPPTGDDCQDRVSSCKYWSTKGFCEATFIYAAEKRSMCARTCNMCAADSNENNNGTTNGGTTNGACDKTPYSDECLSTTCKKPEEKDKDECEKFCSPGGKGEKDDVCRCTDPANKYRQWCAESTCWLQDEKKRDSGCREFCDKDKNTKLDVCDCGNPENKEAYWCVYPDCVHQNDTSYYTDACVEKTCFKMSEKMNNATSSCLELCLTESNKDLPACSCDNRENADIAEWCKRKVDADCTNEADPTKFYSDKCVPVNCGSVEAKQDPESPCYVKCKDPKHENTATCSCATADNKKYATWCKADDPITNVDCHPGNKVIDPDSYYDDDCVETVCAIDEEKKANDSPCRAKCLESKHSTKKVCSCLEAANKNGGATWCDPTCYNRRDTDAYFNANCADIVCAREDEKLLWEDGTCKTVCETDPTSTTDVCLCTNEKNANASWCSAVKTYTGCTDSNDVRAACNAVRCADPGQKLNDKCNDYCRPAGRGIAAGPGSGTAPCLCSNPDNKLAPWCRAEMARSCPIDGPNAAIPWGDCYYFCKLNEAAGLPECNCVATSTSDFCLESHCAVRGPVVLPECQTWCSKPENINRLGCIVP